MILIKSFIDDTISNTINLYVIHQSEYNAGNSPHE